MEMNQGKSSGSKNKWLVGLGIGCGAIIVIIVLLFIGGYFFIKNMTRGFKESENKLSELTVKYGRTEEYCPDPSGAIGPDRLEAFLKAREAVAPSRQRLETSFERLAKDRRSFAAIRRGLGVIPQVADFLSARYQALLDAGMGMGEYCFIYVISYESWLKKPVEDGPGFRFSEGGGLRTNWDREGAQEMQKDYALRRIHRTALPMLKNQLAKLATENEAPGAAASSTGRGGVKGALSKWQEALAAEVKAMEADPHRLPWQDGFPEVLESSLKPFRDRLEASYSRITNMFEISYERK